MHRKFVFPVFFLIATIITAYIYYNYKDSSSSGHDVAEEQGGIYCLNTSRDVFFISSKDYSIIHKTKVNGGWNMAAVRDGKVYVAVRGNLDKAGKTVTVLRDGKLVGNIKLEYSLPRIIKYNEYNGKAYIGHIFFLGKNYITIIDTKNDAVENYLPYNYDINDIAFTKDNKMIVSSRTEEKNFIDIISLDNYSIIKTIPLNFTASSIEVVDSTIYAINKLSSEPFLYAIDLNIGSQTLEKIKLKDDHPCKIYKNMINGNPYIYVTHYNADDMSGESITLIDPERKEAIKRIENAQHARDIAFNNHDILAADRVNEKILILNNSKIIHEIKLGRPISLVNSKI